MITTITTITIPMTVTTTVPMITTITTITIPMTNKLVRQQ